MTNKWYTTLYQFWLHNLERNVKRLSIGFGSLLIVIITTVSLPTPLFLAAFYGASISFGTMVIMSIFGKNGNGVEPEPEPEGIAESSIPEPETTTTQTETNDITEKITLP